MLDITALPIKAIFSQQPLSSLPKLATVERLQLTLFFREYTIMTNGLNIRDFFCSLNCDKAKASRCD